MADAHWYLVWHLPRILSRAGAHVTLLSPRGQPFRHSRFVDAWIEVPHGSAAIAKAAAAHLAEHPCHLLVLAEQAVAEILARTCRDAPCLAWLRPDTADAIQSKTAFHAWSVAQGLPVPDGRACSSPDEASAWVQSHGPSIIKCNGVHGGFGVRRANGPGDVLSAWASLGRPAEFLIQQFIDGQTGVTELVLRQGQVAAWFASTRERASAPLGASVMRRPVNPAGMDEVVARVAQATGFHGLCGFDWVLDAARGRVLMLEFHPRLPSGFGWGRYAGVDISAALRDLLNDRSAPPRSPRPQDVLQHAPRCCYFPAHLWYALRERPADLRFWLPGANAVSWRNVPFDDPMVLAGFLQGAWKRFRTP